MACKYDAIAAPFHDDELQPINLQQQLVQIQ